MERIGGKREELKTMWAHFGLAPLREALPSAFVQRAARNAGCAPRRASLLHPESIVWIMLLTALDGVSMTVGLKSAWVLAGREFSWLAEVRGLTEEAFCRARKRLPVRFWRQLWAMVWHHFQERFASQLAWKGWRVFAVDGTTVSLPNHPEVNALFASRKKGRGGSRAPQGRLVALCSVFTGFCANFKFVPLCYSEHDALRHLIRSMRSDDLVLLDRGFFSL
jgi:hypothetical protein